MSAASTMSYPSYLAPNTLTMFNINNLLNQKDSRWLQLEVCREFQRQKCTRTDAECKFAHPPANVEVQNGRVTACYDSIKGRCNREKPACKYFHPPQHLKDQLLINGRNHLALKNALAQQMQQQIIPGQIPAVNPTTQATFSTHNYSQNSSLDSLLFGAPYLSASLPLAYNPYLSPGQLISPLLPPPPTQQDNPPVVSHAPPPQNQQPQLQQKQRSDRIEVCREYLRGCCNRPECRFAHPPDSVPPDPDGTVRLCMDHVRGRCTRTPCRYYHSVHTQHRTDQDLPSDPSSALPNGNVLPYKRSAADKSGLPVYQPGPLQQPQHYQQALMQLQQPFVPVTYNSGQQIALPRYQ